MQLILNGDARPILFFMAQSGDHITGLTGVSPVVAVSKNGAAFAAPAGAVAEIGNGWYALTPSGSDVTTNGAFLLHAIAAGGDPADVKAQVVAFDPYDAFPTANAVLPESYAANGAPATLAQLLYGLSAVLGNISQSGVTLTANRLDGVTPAMSFTLDNATAPTSRRRAA